MCGAAISAAQVSNITEAVMEKIIEYPQGINGNQGRPMATAWMQEVGQYRSSVAVCRGLSHYLSGLYRGKNQAGQARHQQGGLCGAGRKHARPQGIVGALAVRKRRGQVLAGLIPSGAQENRGIKDVFVACADGLAGFPDAIGAVFPNKQVIPNLKLA